MVCVEGRPYSLLLCTSILLPVTRATGGLKGRGAHTRSCDQHSSSSCRGCYLNLLSAA